MRKVLKTVLKGAGWFLLAWYAMNSVYFARPIAGRVVAEGTGVPLPGVTVAADWQLQDGLEGGWAMGHVAILETVTDADGRFRFPGWGPRFAFPLGRLKDRDPQLLFFKADYFPLSLVNEHQSSGWVQWVHTSDSDGETIPLEPASMRPDRYASSVEGFADRVHVSFFYPGSCAWWAIPQLLCARCAWRALPHLLLALDEEGSALTRKGPLIETPSLASWNSSNSPCRVDEDYVRRNGRWAQ